MEVESEEPLAEQDSSQVNLDEPERKPGNQEKLSEDLLTSTDYICSILPGNKSSLDLKTTNDGISDCTENLKSVEKESKESVEKESKDSVEKDRKESVEKDEKESVEKESKESVEKDRKESVEKESKESVKTDSKDTKESVNKEREGPVENEMNKIDDSVEKKSEESGETDMKELDEREKEGKKVIKKKIDNSIASTEKKETNGVEHPEPVAALEQEDLLDSGAELNSDKCKLEVERINPDLHQTQPDSPGDEDDIVPLVLKIVVITPPTIESVSEQNSVFDLNSPLAQSTISVKNITLAPRAISAKSSPSAPNKPSNSNTSAPSTSSTKSKSTSKCGPAVKRKASVASTPTPLVQGPVSESSAEDDDEIQVIYHKRQTSPSISGAGKPGIKLELGEMAQEFISGHVPQSRSMEKVEKKMIKESHKKVEDLGSRKPSSKMDDIQILSQVHRSLEPSPVVESCSICSQGFSDPKSFHIHLAHAHFKEVLQKRIYNDSSSFNPAQVEWTCPTCRMFVSSDLDIVVEHYGAICLPIPVKVSLYILYIFLWSLFWYFKLKNLLQSRLYTWNTK